MATWQHGNMAHYVINAMKMLEDYILTGKRVEKIISDAAVTGTRAAPTKSGENDKHIAVRLDFGESMTRNGQNVRHVKVQPNKGANDKSIAKLAAENSHQVVAEGFIPIDSPQPKEAIRRLFQDLREDAKDNNAAKDAKKPSKKGGKK